MRACSRARGGAFAAIGLIVLITGGVTGVTLGELALMQPSVQQAQPARGASHAPIKAKLASVGSPCGLGSVGAGNGWGLRLPARYLVNGSVDEFRRGWSGHILISNGVPPRTKGAPLTRYQP